MNVIRWVLRVHPRSNHENQVALPHHLNDFYSSFDGPLDTEAEWLQRKNREALRCANRKRILVLVETDACDLLIAKHLF